MEEIGDRNDRDHFIGRNCSYFGEKASEGGFFCNKMDKIADKKNVC